jgi:hypothetical protein
MLRDYSENEAMKIAADLSDRHLFLLIQFNEEWSTAGEVGVPGRVAKYFVDNGYLNNDTNISSNLYCLNSLSSKIKSGVLSESDRFEIIS